MAARTKHNAGFTLAELLIVIAIILVLAALAIPSIITAQNNMRMMELNNAAESIANAAQTQMTAKKVAGTWLSAIEKGGTGTDAKNVKYPRAKNLPADMPSDTYYMTATEARNSGIVPSLSVDDSVRNGDYIIEFTASTANVASVFYTDGKSGFFGSAPASTEAAQQYYTGESSRDQAARMANSPMIGYYQGTPTGATNAIALRNPVVYVDETTGCLMIQDPNIADNGSAGTTTSTVRIENTTVKEDVSTKLVFVLSSLSNDTSLMYVATEDGGTEFSLSGSELEDVMKQVDRNGTSNGNVFSIDLNALSRKVAAADGKTDLKNVFANCLSNDALTVTVETKDASTSSVPATARANIKWPASVAKLALYVTNPSSKQVGGQAEYVTGTYIDPTVGTVDQEGEGAVTPDAVVESASNEIKKSAINDALVKENPQAGTQFYTGGWVGMGEAASSLASLKATAGSYEINGTAHQYQVWELWVKQKKGDYTRVGYMRNNEWEWYSNYSELKDCLTWHKADGTVIVGDIAGQNAENIVAITVNAAQLQDLVAKNTVDLADDTGSVEMYVRTAPKSTEVQDYFNRMAEGKTLDDNFLDGASESASRRVEEQASETARKAFENEFGASSSDVSWTVSSARTDGGYEQANTYLSEGANVRVYYSVSPGIGFDNIKNYSSDMATVLKGVRSTQMTNVALWLYRGNSMDDLNAMPAALVVSTQDDPFTCRYSTSAGNKYDFKITNQEDNRFYRVLTYIVKSGAVASQYVPHIEASNENVAAIAAANNYADDDYAYMFSHWATSNTTNGAPLEVPAAGKVGDYPALAMQGTTLTAVYRQYVKGIGLVYFESYADSTMGYYGYLDGQEGDSLNTLNDEKNIVEWGYRLVVPKVEGQENKKPTVTNDGVSIYEKSLSEGDPLDIDGVAYRAFKFSTNEVMYLKTNTLSYQYDDLSAQYTFNLNFARAVARGGGDPRTAKLTTGESAWDVRHATQFPGSLSWYNNPSIQSVYQNNSFAQTRSIDMMSLPSGLPGSATKYQNAFRGVYDGKSYAIKNVSARFLLKQADISIVDMPGVRAWGLFPAASRATFANISIIEDANLGQLSLVGTNGFSFGMLVGYAENCTVTNCSVEGGKNTVNVSASNSNAATVIGGLIGKAVQTTIAGCTVSHLNLSLSSTNNTAWKNEPSLGGLVGYLVESSIDPKEDNEPLAVATDVKLSVSTVSNADLFQYYGGVVGRAEGKVSIMKSFADTVLVTGPVRADEEVRTMKVGSYIGRYDGKGNPIMGNGKPVGISQRYGTENSTEVTAEIGYPDE